VTEAAARRRCEELNAELPRGAAPWTVRRVEPGDWRPARARVPDLPPRAPYTATTEARPKPPHQDDPRDSQPRGIPGYTT
jgi:hypothetical protein